MALWMSCSQSRTAGFPLGQTTASETGFNRIFSISAPFCFDVSGVSTLHISQWARIRMNRMNQGPLRYGVQPLVKFCRPVSYLGLMPFNFIWKKKPLTKFWSPAHQVQVSASEAT